jgi:hypothetical protein
MAGVRMRSQEVNGRIVYKVGTPRVGRDGLRELLIARHGQRGGGSSENTRSGDGGSGGN